MSRKRIDAIRKRLRSENLDGLVVNHLDQVRYLTGFTGTAGLLVITAGGAEFFTDFRYEDQAGKQVKGARVNTIEGEAIASLKDFPKLGVKNRKYGFCSEHLTVAGREKLQTALADALFVSADGVFAELGWVKEPEEITNIARAVEISDIAFERILKMVVPGVRENELAAELEYQMRMLGSDRPTPDDFETIVASGHRSALPHGVASTKKIRKNEFVTFDFGAVYKGYVSDMTRTVIMGKATSRQKKVYDIVLRSQKAGIKRVKAGVSCRAVDDICRRVITKAGYGKNFRHGTGHGIGYHVHLGPRLSPRSKDKLMVNNVITIEPGIYISGWGGVRIEDDVVVTRNGSRVLNKAPKNLLEL